MRYAILKLNFQNFTSQLLKTFAWSIFRLVASFRLINFLSGESLGKLIKCLSALEWPPRSPDIAV